MVEAAAIGTVKGEDEGGFIALGSGDVFVRFSAALKSMGPKDRSPQRDPCALGLEKNVRRCERGVLILTLSPKRIASSEPDLSSCELVVGESGALVESTSRLESGAPSLYVVLVVSSGSTHMDHEFMMSSISSSAGVPVMNVCWAPT